MARKSKKRVIYPDVVREPPVDALMKRVRIVMLGASEDDWRDQDWATPHGRLFLRAKRHAKWRALPEKQRPRLVPRDQVFINKDQYAAACRFLEIRTAFLRAFGAPGLPIELPGDSKASCPICGSYVKCLECEENFQNMISDAYDRANRCIRGAGAGCREAVATILVNPAASYEFRPEEVYAAMVPDMARGLSALDVLLRSSSEAKE